MADKTRFAAFLTGDHARRAELYVAEGKLDKAMKLYAKAGDHRSAGRLAVRLRDEPAAVHHFLRAALGAAAESYATASAAQAGEVLAASGHIEDAIDLLVLGGDFRAAAEASLKLKRKADAAKLFERAREWRRAAVHYEQVGRIEDAVRVLEAESRRLANAPRRPGDDPESEKRAVDQRRAELLSRLGRGREAVELVGDTGPSRSGARVLEQNGKLAEAIRAYLEEGAPREALRLVGKAKGLDRRLAAEVYRRSGHHGPAAELYAELGDAAAAARAYRDAGSWGDAAVQWERAGDLMEAAKAFELAGRMEDAGRCYARSGESDRAASAFADVGDDTRAAEAYLRAGDPLAASTHFLAAGSSKDASIALQKIGADDPRFEQATYALVPLLLEEGYADAALHRLDLLPEQAGPGRAAAERHYWRGRAQEEAGRVGEAVESYQKVVGLSRDHRDVTGRLKALAPSAGAGTIAAAAPSGGTPEPVAPGAVTAMASPLSGSDVAPGVVLADRYELVEEIGRGGMGKVYRARDRELGEEVAIKTVLRPPGAGDELEERLVRELQICRKITHPNVVRVYDLGRMPGGIFITMELLEGARLDELLKGGKQLSLVRVKGILRDILAGLREAHRLSVVHRDLKPSNVMLTPGRLKLLDFGVAQMQGFDVKLTQTGFAVGSPLYMSPEQIQGEPLGGRSDLYSLGVLTFRLLTGREPFEGPNAAVIVMEHLSNPPPDPRRYRGDLPDPWKRFVLRLLEKPAAQRYASVDEVLDVVDDLPI